jgi:hypothetical protein
LIPSSLQPILYLIHVDAICRPTVAVPDIFGDSPPNESAQSFPNVKYLFMMLPQSEWSTTWDSFIHKKHRELVITHEKAESDESGDEGFVRQPQIPPPSATPRRRKPPGVGSRLSPWSSKSKTQEGCKRKRRK